MSAKYLICFAFLFAALHSNAQWTYPVPQKVQAELERAREAYNDENYQLAEDIYHKYYNLYPADRDLVFGLALCAEATQQKELAIMYYNQLEHFEHYFPELYFNRGMLRYRLGQHESALGDFEKALGMDVKETLSVNYKGMRYSASGGNMLVKTGTTQNWKEEYSIWMARSMIKIGREGEALQIIRNLIEQSPESADLHLIHAELLREVGLNKEAVSAYLRAADLELDNPVAAYQLIEMQKENISKLEVEQAFTKLSEKYPELPEIKTNLAIEAYNEGDYMKALRLLDDVLAVEKNQPSYFFNRGLVWRKLDNPRMAEQDFRMALRLDPDAPGYLAGLAASLMEQSKFQEAIQSWELALAAEPSSVTYRYNLGYAYYRKGDSSRACLHLNEAARRGHTKAAEIARRLCGN
jgi:tetratricopeptide (TPR) repeat protein